jgi:hypothetical protein
MPDGIVPTKFLVFICHYLIYEAEITACLEMLLVFFHLPNDCSKPEVKIPGTEMSSLCSRHGPVSCRFKTDCGNDHMIVHLRLNDVSFRLAAVQGRRNEIVRILFSLSNPEILMSHQF